MKYNIDKIYTPIVRTDRDGTVMEKNIIAKSMKYLKVGKSTMSLLSDEDADKYRKLYGDGEPFIATLRVRRDAVYIRAYLFRPEDEDFVYWMLFNPLQIDSFIPYGTCDNETLNVLNKLVPDFFGFTVLPEYYSSERSPEVYGALRKRLWENFAGIISGTFGHLSSIDFIQAAETLANCRFGNGRKAFRITNTVREDIIKAGKNGVFNAFDRITSLFAVLVLNSYRFACEECLAIDFSSDGKRLNITYRFKAKNRKAVCAAENIRKAFSDILDGDGLEYEAVPLTDALFDIKIRISFNAYAYIDSGVSTPMPRFFITYNNSLNLSLICELYYSLMTEIDDDGDEYSDYSENDD